MPYLGFVRIEVFTIADDTHPQKATQIDAYATKQLSQQQQNRMHDNKIEDRVP